MKVERKGQKEQKCFGGVPFGECFSVEGGGGSFVYIRIQESEQSFNAISPFDGTTHHFAKETPVNRLNMKMVEVE